MANWKKLAQGAAGAGGGAGLNVEEVFSTFVYTGTDNAGFDINNGIDLSTEGGMIWNKGRELNLSFNVVWDTERGTTKYLFTSESDAEGTNTQLTSFNTDGVTFSSRSLNGVNDSRQSNVLWTFRKAPKFFDVVTYTGTGSAGLTVSHNLGVAPGCIIVKNVSRSTDWMVLHRNDGSSYKNLNLNEAFADIGFLPNYWGDGSSFYQPTGSDFKVGTGSNVNFSGDTYVAYLFAHNDGDGEFGPTGDQDIIKCGSYTGDGQDQGPDVTLGFEPQWIMIKRTDSAGNWIMLDNMRGIVTGDNDKGLYAERYLVENTTPWAALTPTGFKVEGASSAINANGGNYIYIAIRRGPMAVPESATDVFAMDRFGATSPTPPGLTSGFPVDFGFYRYITSGGSYNTHFRLTQGKYLSINATDAEVSDATALFDYMDGYYSYGGGLINDFVGWMWRRAPNFFDVTTWVGNRVSGTQIAHNLGVVPEMIVVKSRSEAKTWITYHKDIDVNGDGNPETDYILLNTNQAAGDYDGFFYDTAPTSTHFTIGNDRELNDTGKPYIAMLFASLDGISKVGGYTGNGTSSGNSQTITTGFQPRLVWIKRWDSSGDWMLFDTERGITTNGNDQMLATNTTNTGSNADRIDLTSTGFTVKFYNVAASNPNINNAKYIYYAIA